MNERLPFRLTYSTMFDPPPALHQAFDEAVAKCLPALGQDHPLIVAGQPRDGAGFVAVHSPIDRGRLLARFPRATRRDVDDSVKAARAAAPAWAALPCPDRIALLRRAAALIEERVYEIGAIVAREFGKNRRESIAKV